MVIPIINNKGGVGKTTTTANLGVALARKGKRVLMIDLDAQLSLSTMYFDREEVLEEYQGENIYTALTDFDINAKDLAVNIEPNLDIVVSTIPMASIDIELSNNTPLMMNAVDFFRNAAESYDFVLIDCPPNLGVTTGCAVMASTGVIIPVTPQVLPVQGLMLMRESLHSCGLYAKELRVIKWKVLITQQDRRRTLDKQVTEELRAEYPDGVFKAVIPYNSKIAESPLIKKTAIDYDPKGKGATAYQELADELINGKFDRHALTPLEDKLTAAIAEDEKNLKEKGITLNNPFVGLFDEPKK